jgi:hypothetical protein
VGDTEVVLEVSGDTERDVSSSSYEMYPPPHCVGGVR